MLVTFKITRPEFMATWRRVHSRRAQASATSGLTAAGWVFVLWVMSGRLAGAALLGIIYLPICFSLTVLVAPWRHWSRIPELHEERVQRSKESIEQKGRQR